MTKESPEPVWLSWRIIDAIHFDQVLQHGGDHKVRDLALIESALSRPINKWHYEKPNIFLLGAAYAFGIAKNHGFIDGNKRTGFLALYTFLGLNGYDLDAPEPEVVRVMNEVVKGILSEQDLATWVESSSRPLPQE